MLKKVKVVAIGTVNTECVYTVPIAELDSDLSLNVIES